MFSRNRHRGGQKEMPKKSDYVRCVPRVYGRDEHVCGLCPCVCVCVCGVCVCLCVCVCVVCVNMCI